MKPISLCGVILAGGQSSRMGRPKELLDWGGRALLVHLAESVAEAGLPCLVVSNTPDRLPLADLERLGVRLTGDQVESRGPISGLITALRVTSEDGIAVFSCDLPFVDRDVVSRLAGYRDELTRWDALVASTDGRLHPLLALYHRRTQPVWEAAFACGRYRVTDVLSQLCVKQLTGNWADRWAAYNMNTPDEYETALKERRRRDALSSPDADR